MKRTLYVTEVSEFYENLLDETNDNMYIQFINEDMIQMTFDKKNQFIDNSNDTNIYIACFTTSHARLMLYDVLDKLKDRVLGFDTDSAWYIEKPNDSVKIQTGDSLGELTDELNGKYITKWCATGPKSYSYTTSDGKQVCKVRGFTLNYENSKYINNNTMLDIIKNKHKDITIVKENMITRDSKNKQIVNKYNEKVFRLCYDKRIINIKKESIDTLPYGYKWQLDKAVSTTLLCYVIKILKITIYNNYQWFDGLSFVLANQISY